VNLLLGDRSMLDTLWNDKELTRPEGHASVAQLDDKASLEHEEEIIGVVAPVPDELTESLDDHEIVTVELADGSRLPMLRERRQLLCKVDLIHRRRLPGCCDAQTSARPGTVDMLA
jgi:hypothetical protein